MKYQDIFIVNSEGIIIYIDVSNAKTLAQPPEQLIGKKVSEIFKNVNEETSTLMAAVKTGRATVDYEQELITKRNDKIIQISSTYPIMDEDKIVGAIEFSEFKYRMDSIECIHSHWDRPIYRKNNTRYTIDDIISRNAEMDKIKKMIRKVSRTDSTVLVTGETGTGKELVAQSIHNLSERVNKPFVSQNCGAIPGNLMESMLFGTVKGGFTGAENKKGLLEAAQGGTIFLDEINSLSMELQVKILKVIEDRKIRKIGDTEEMDLDVRFIVAMNEDAEKLIQDGLFRADLYYRISVVQIELPRLIERKEDIELIANHYIDYYNYKLQKNVQYIPDEILAIFSNYHWPGNIRELRNVIERIFNLCDSDELTIECLPRHMRLPGQIQIRNHDKNMENAIQIDIDSPIDLKEIITEYERQIILAAYEKNNCNMTKTAKDLGISRQLLRYKLDNEK